MCSNGFRLRIFPFAFPIATSVADCTGEPRIFLRMGFWKPIHRSKGIWIDGGKGAGMVV